MVGFKKDPSKKDKWSNFKSEVQVFIAGMIISAFIILYLIILIVSKMVNNLTPVIPTTSSEEITSSEPITSSSESLSSNKDYSIEKKIIDNIIESIEFYSSGTIAEVTSIYSDTDYIYFEVMETDSTLTIYQGELNGRDINEILESLTLSSDDTLISSMYESYELKETSPSILDLELFKNDDRFKGYTYKCLNETYTSHTEEEIFLSAIGYKDSQYQIIASIIYNKSSSSFDEPRTSIIYPSSITSIYKDVIEYLYNK